MALLRFATSHPYPGVIPIHARVRTLRDGETVVPRTVHPVYLDMREDFEPPLEPLMPPDTGTYKGTPYQFVTSTASVHHQRAWHLSGFTNWQLACDVRFPNNAIRASNAGGPHTSWIPVALSGSGSAPAKRIGDSCRIVAPPTFPVARAGIPGGYLDTNCGMSGTLGTWDMAGLTETFYTASDTALSGVTVNNWDGGGTVLLGALAVYLKVEIAVYGNTSLLRFRSGSTYAGPWRYPSIFFAEVRFTLHLPDYSTGILEAADGSHDADVNIGGSLSAPTGLVSSLLESGIAAEYAVECGETAVASLSPNVQMYHEGVTPASINYPVPWEYPTPGADVAAVTEVRNFTLAFTGRVDSTLPADL